MSCQATCLRLTIVINTFILWIIGILSLASGCFLKLSHYVQYTLDPNTSSLILSTNEFDSYFSSFAWFLILLGLFTILTAILGACGVGTGQFSLIVYSLLIFILLFGQTFIFLVYSGYVETEKYDNFNESQQVSVVQSLSYIPLYLNLSLLSIFKSALKFETWNRGSLTQNGINSNGFSTPNTFDISPIGSAIIGFQNKFNCCGYHDACDYCDYGEQKSFGRVADAPFFEKLWRHNRTIGDRDGKSCKFDSRRCKNMCTISDIGLTDMDSFYNNVDPDSDLEHTGNKSSFPGATFATMTGCRPAFEKLYNSKRLTYEIIIISWLMLQFLVCFFAIFLCCLNRKIAKDQEKFQNDHIRYQNEHLLNSYKYNGNNLDNIDRFSTYNRTLSHNIDRFEKEQHASAAQQQSQQMHNNSTMRYGSLARQLTNHSGISHHESTPIINGSLHNSQDYLINQNENEQLLNQQQQQYKSNIMASPGAGTATSMNTNNSTVYLQPTAHPRTLAMPQN